MSKPSAPTARSSAVPLPSNRRTSAFERRIAQQLRPALEVGERLLIAVSGGPDSTALLVAVAHALSPEQLTAAHYDHRLRPHAEVKQERNFIAGIARQLHVPLVTGRSATSPASHAEEVAREARYRWLARAAQNTRAATCLTGHTLDDQAETVLLRLARGTAGAGASGMSTQAPWPVTVRGVRSPRLLRPMLTLTRAEVQDYLDALQVTAMEDPTNASVDYARNRIRGRVMGELKEVNARAPQHLARFADQQREDEAALTQIAKQWLRTHATYLGTPPYEVQIERRLLREQPTAIALRIIREAGNTLGLTLQATHLRGILESLGRNRVELDLPLARSATSGMILRLRLQPSPDTGTD